MLDVIFMYFSLYVVNLLHFQSYQKYSIYFYHHLIHSIYFNLIYLSLYLYLIKYDDIYDNK